MNERKIGIAMDGQMDIWIDRGVYGRWADTQVGGWKDREMNVCLIFR